MEDQPDDRARVRSSTAALIEENFDLVGRVISKKVRWRASRERADLEQIGAIGLIHAARCFDPQRKVAFRSYATHRIRGEVLTFERDRAAKRRGCTPSSLEIDPIGRDDPFAAACITDVRDELMRTLSERSATMAQLYFFEGHTLLEIAERFHVSEVRVGQLLRPVRERLRELLRG